MVFKVIAAIWMTAQILFAQAVWDGTANTDWYTETSPFTINTAEDLAGLAQLVNGGNNFAGQVVVLGANIVLNDVSNWKDWSATVAPDNRWTPIGSTNANAFRGTFDGNGNTISGAYISALSNDQALFGYVGAVVSNVAHGTIKNLNVIKSFSRGWARVAGIVAQVNAGGRIINCYFNGNVQGGENVGGLAGSNSANNAVIDNSRSSGTVAGISIQGAFSMLNGNNIGGLVGNNGGGQIYNSSSNASVSGNLRSGGLVGNQTGAAAIHNSFATGNVSGDSIAGGLVGGTFVGPIISNSFAAGSVVSTRGAAGGLAGIVSGTGVFNSFYDSQTSGQAGAGIGKTTAQMQSLDLINALNGFGAIITIPENHNVSIRKWNYYPSAYPVFGNENLEVKTVDDFFAGDGTENDPWIISEREHLTYFSAFINMATPATFEGRHFKLGADIELNDNSATDWHNWETAPPANVWVPIGTGTGATASRQFRGTFDGNFHTISGVYMNSAGGSGQGLFGNVGVAGTIRNLGLINSYIRVNDSWVGGIVGDLAGRLENSFSTAWVAGINWVGGLAGRPMGIAALIINSYFDGTVEVIGTNATPTIGGIAGGNTATANPQPRIENSYSTGRILMNGTGAQSNIGAIAGNINQVQVVNSYFDREITERNAVGVGVNINANAAQFTENLRLQSDIFAAWDFDAVWAFDPRKNNGYPHLRGFIYAIDPRNPEEICFERGEIWCEDEENCISLPDEELKQRCEENPDFVWCEVLNRCRPRVDWYDGKESPFVILTANGLERLAFLVNEGIDDFEGKTVKLGADITLSGNWAPIGRNAENPFGGIFDGQSNTISGLTVAPTMFAGLFGYITDGQIKNVNLVEANVKAAQSGRSYAGILAGFYNSDKTIENVFVSGTVLGQGGTSSADTDASFAGGLIGWANSDNLIIRNSRVNASVLSPATGQGTGGGGIRLGGFAGYSHGNNLLIEESFANVNISGVAQRIGGFVGQAQRSIIIRNSHVNGNINAAHSSVSAGGFIGVAAYLAEIENCYVRGNFTGGFATRPAAIIGNANSPDITATSVFFDLTTADLAVGNISAEINGIDGVLPAALKNKATFDDWDFDDIWAINVHINGGFAHLQEFAAHYEHTPCVAENWTTTKEPTCTEDGEEARICTICGKTIETRPIPQLTDGSCNPNFIRDRNPTDIRYGILLENAIVSDIARISVITPELAQITLRILDVLGNVVFTETSVGAGLKPARTNAADNAIIWNLTNQSGRFVANGTYLIIVEARGISGKIHTYSTRIGVNR
ncbi:MAG: hypothetical protein FWE23_07855 [Chitinivibrionia bacterium]|nr:hypothetical protein [Chitinivibrionia bacterium]